MLTPDQLQRALRILEVIEAADDAFRQEFMDEASLLRIPPGRDVFAEGDRIDSIPLLLSGVVRVYQMGESGREVTLYRFRPGESCVLTANAILSQQAFPAIATVEEEAEAIMIPEATFRRWVDEYRPWRHFFFDMVSQRLASVMQLVEQVAFRRLDRRIALLLVERAQEQNPIQTTHQEIADELGSSREVISRILDDFASGGLVRTGRGEIEVVNGEALRRLAAM
jgi:CRP/FNR family transcriptional regulator